MRLEIRPDATDEERRALTAALADATARRPAAYDSAWRLSRDDPGEDRLYATARRRSTAGARRA